MKIRFPVEAPDFGPGKRAFQARERAGALIIVLMAEYTTDQGPWVDDYFLVFWTLEDGRLQRAIATFYSDGVPEVMTRLAAYWKCDAHNDFYSSTDWDSRIIWPEEFAGQKYLAFAESAPKNISDRLKRLLLGPTLEYTPTPAVRSLLRRYDPQAFAESKQS